MKRILIGMLFWFGISQAQTIPQVLQLQEPPLPLVTNINANYVGGVTGGVTTYYYWIVARYVAGNSNLSAPVAVANLTIPRGSVIINWVQPQVAVTPTIPLRYDVIRTTSNQFPSSGTCTNCLVLGNTLALTATDSLGTLSGYSTNTYTPNVYNISLNNTDMGVNSGPPQLVVNSATGGANSINLLQYSFNPLFPTSNSAPAINNNNPSTEDRILLRFNNTTMGSIGMGGSTNTTRANQFRLGTSTALGTVHLQTANQIDALVCDQNQVCTFTNPCVGCGSGNVTLANLPFQLQQAGLPNDATFSISAATHASSVQFTTSGVQVLTSPGQIGTVVIAGGTGSWAVANGTWTATGVDSNNFTIPLNTSALGALTGTITVTEQIVLAIIPSWLPNGNCLPTGVAPTDLTGHGYNPTIIGGISGCDPPITGQPSAGVSMDGTTGYYLMPATMNGRVGGVITVFDNSPYNNFTSLPNTSPEWPLIGGTSANSFGMFVGDASSSVGGNTGTPLLTAYVPIPGPAFEKSNFGCNVSNGFHVLSLEFFTNPSSGTFDLYCDGAFHTAFPGSGGFTQTGQWTIGAHPGLNLFTPETHFITIFLACGIGSAGSGCGFGFGVEAQVDAILRNVLNSQNLTNAIGTGISITTAPEHNLPNGWGYAQGFEGSFFPFTKVAVTVLGSNTINCGDKVVNTVPWMTATAFANNIGAESSHGYDIFAHCSNELANWPLSLATESAEDQGAISFANFLAKKNIFILSVEGLGNLLNGDSAAWTAEGILNLAQQIKQTYITNGQLGQMPQILLVGLPSYNGIDSGVTGVNSILQSEWHSVADAFVNPQYATGFASGGFANPSASCVGSVNCYQASGTALTNAGASTFGAMVSAGVNYLAAGVGGSIVISGTYSMTGTEGDIFANGTFTITAPTWLGFPNQGRRITNTGSGVITIAAPSGYTMNGTTTLPANSSCNLFGDGTTKLYCELETSAPVITQGGCPGTFSVSITALPATTANFSPCKTQQALSLKSLTGVASGATFTCATPPVITLQDCGVSSGACGSPTTLASVTLSVANTITNSGTTFPVSVSAGHYLAYQITAGTCVAVPAGLSANAVWQ